MSEKLQNESFFFLKSKCYEQHNFHEKHMSFWWLLLFKFCRSFTWNQTSSIIFVTDVSRASENHLQCQSNISTGLLPLFLSYSNLKNRRQELALVLHSYQVTEPLKPHGEKPTIFSIMYLSPLHPHLPQITLSYKKGNLLACFLYSKTCSSSFLYVGIALQSTFVLLH